MPTLKAELIDHMGSDLTVVNAARVSFNKESDYLNLKDEKLISYLSTHGHFTPFTHTMVTLRESVPIFVARQRFKHVVGFTYNEVSRRYVDTGPEFFMPDGWRLRAENVKQGSSDEMLSGWAQDHLNEQVGALNSHALATYKKLLREGTAPEQARMVLPQSMLTAYYVTGSLSAWARAYKLRAEKSAQKEIQILAEQWDAIIRPLFPISWDALTKGHKMEYPDG